MTKEKVLKRKMSSEYTELEELMDDIASTEVENIEKNNEWMPYGRIKG